jgi:predicted esterase
VTAIDPHANQPVLRAGTNPKEAEWAMVLLHGRNATACSILPLAEEFREAKIAFVAPQAAQSMWYPNSFLAPRPSNEPWLSSALARVRSVVADLAEGGIPRERVFVCGFSQGACLATEFVASHPARYAGLIAFTGGLIGPRGADLAHAGSLEGTPALLLSGDPDPHVPWSRVEESEKILAQMGAAVKAQRFPGRPHTISEPELLIAQSFVNQLLERRQPSRVS